MPTPIGSRPDLAGGRNQRAHLRRTDVETYNVFFFTPHTIFSPTLVIFHPDDDLIPESQIHAHSLRILLLDLRFELQIFDPPAAKIGSAQIDRSPDRWLKQR